MSAYYQTRAEHHHGVVSSDWLAQAAAAVGGKEEDSSGDSGDGKGGSKAFSVIEEFNNWRKQPDLAEAVAAIRALAAVIRNSEANTMMELEIELKKASDSLKVSEFGLFICVLIMRCNVSFHLSVLYRLFRFYFVYIS